MKWRTKSAIRVDEDEKGNETFVRNFMQEFNNTDMEQRRKRNIMDESQVEDMEEPEEELTRREEEGEGEETEWIEQDADKVSTVKRIPTCRKKNKRTRVRKVAKKLANIW